MASRDPFAEFAPADPAPAPADPWADFQPAEPTPPVRSGVRMGTTVTPEQAASTARLVRETGLPPDVVQRNLVTIQRDALAERVDRDTAGAPVLRERFTNPTFAGMAADDAATLARLETRAGSYTAGSALNKGVASIKLTWDFLADQLAKAVGGDRTTTQKALHETVGFYRAQGSDPELAAAGERARTAGGDTWYGTLLHLPGEVIASDDALGVIGRFMTEQLPASVVGFGIGAAATAPVRAQVAQRVANQLVARGVNVGIAGAAGNSTAVVVGAAGANYAEGLQQGLTPEQASARAWTKTLAEVPYNAWAGAMMGLQIGPGAITNILSQSVVQGAGGGLGAAQAAHAVGEQADSVEIALEILGETVSAGPELAGLTLSRIGQSATAARAESAQAAVDSAAQVGDMIKDADASALKARDATAFREFVQSVQPEGAVFVSPQALEGVDLSALPEIAAQRAEALATGGDVRIPLADLLAHLPGEQLLPHLRVEPDAMTLTEAQSFDGATELMSEITAQPTGEALVQTPESAQALGMDADAWATYMQAANEADDAAVQYRGQRTLRDMQWLANSTDKTLRTVKREAKAARTTLEAEARAEVEQMPVYRAQRFLATAEGQALPADVVAERFGYTSGDEMQAAVKAAEPEATAIEGRADQRMLERYPDLVDEITQRREAEARVADRARERFIATEAAALSRAVGSQTLLAQQARAYAQASISRRDLRSISPTRFRAAAARAARAAAEAFRKGDTAAAARHKRQQALQTSLQIEAGAASAEIEQAERRFKRMVSKREDSSRDGNLADTARAILAQYGLAPVEKTAADYLAKVERYDPELHADLLALMDGLPAPVGDHRTLTVGDFRVVRDRVEAVWSLARSTREIEVDGQKVDIDTAAQQLANRLGDKTRAKREAIVGRNEKLDLRMRLAGMRAALRRVEFWADARDGGDAAGPFRRFIWQPVSEAVTRYRGEKARHVAKFLALLKTIEPTLKPGKIAAPELGDGVTFADRSALLHALLHTGNESNKRKLLLGYKWAFERDDGTLDTSRWDAFLDRMHKEGRISRADWQFAQGVWDLLEEMKPAAQSAHKRMFGHYFDEITAAPVQTPFGEFRGGYVPALTDSLLVPEARGHGAMDDMLASQNSPMFPAVGRGFTKARVENYSRPLALDLRLMPAHIDKVARFAVLGPVLRDTARLVSRNRTFTQAMNGADPQAIESMLVPWLKRTATQTLTKAPETQADRAVAKLATAARNRTGLLLMSANVINTLQQVTGMSVAALRVKPRHLAGGLLELMRDPSATGKAINELSPWMQQRTDEGSRDVDRAIDDMLLNPSLRQKAEQAGSRYGYALQQVAQNFLDRTVWLGAYRQATAQGATDADAVRQADAAVRMTQSSFAPEDSAKVEHAGAFTRLFLQFYSYFSGQANVLATEVQNAKGNPARLAYVYLMGFAIPAFVAELIAQGARGELDDFDDEEGLAIHLLKTFFSSQARYALAMVPIAGQAGNAALGQLTPERFDDRIGASPVYSAVEATVRAPFSIWRAATDDANPRTAVRDFLTAVAVLTGLPTGPLVRPLGYLADDRRDEDEITVRGLVTGRDTGE
jgi:hypothetical protein